MKDTLVFVCHIATVDFGSSGWLGEKVQFVSALWEKYYWLAVLGQKILHPPAPAVFSYWISVRIKLEVDDVARRSSYIRELVSRRRHPVHAEVWEPEKEQENCYRCLLQPKWSDHWNTWSASSSSQVTTASILSWCPEPKAEVWKKARNRPSPACRIASPPRNRGETARQSAAAASSGPWWLWWLTQKPLQRSCSCCCCLSKVQVQVSWDADSR